MYSINANQVRKYEFCSPGMKQLDHSILHPTDIAFPTRWASMNASKRVVCRASNGELARVHQLQLQSMQHDLLLLLFLLEPGMGHIEHGVIRSRAAVERRHTRHVGARGHVVHQLHIPVSQLGQNPRAGLPLSMTLSTLRIAAGAGIARLFRGRLIVLQHRLQDMAPPATVRLRHRHVPPCGHHFPPLRSRESAGWFHYFQDHTK